MDKQLAIKLANPRWSIGNKLITREDTHALLELIPDEKREEYTKVIKNEGYPHEKIYALCMALTWHLSMQVAARNGFEPATNPDGTEHLMLTTHPFAVIDHAVGEEDGKEMIEQYLFPYRPAQAAMSVAGIHRINAESVMIAFADKQQKENAYYIAIAWLPITIERAIGYFPLLAGS